MKIRKIHYIKHQVFNNHTVIFGEDDVPSISFLVGNNGSGKTRVLDTIFQAFTQPFVGSVDFEINIYLTLSPEEMTEFSVSNERIVYNIKRDAGNNSLNVSIENETTIRVNIAELSKVIFSTIEVNFGESTISSVTSKNIDDQKKPRERSQNLSFEIPQLLIDISSLDDAEQGKWYKENAGNTGVSVPKGVGNRLDRFTNAFHSIYGGSKTFLEIDNVDGTKRIIFVDEKNQQISLGEMSTGEKQIIYRVGYILKNLANIHGGIILIDEPEISLHPSWQIKLKDFLLEIFRGYDVQIIIATHSSYIFQNLQDKHESCIKIDRSNNVSEKISMIFPGVPYTPSVNLINYLAYGIHSELLHMELYTLIQIREKRDKITNSYNRVSGIQNNDGIENWLQDPAGGNIPVSKTFTKTGKTTLTSETIMTWIRNKIHHSDELARPSFTQSELKQSIDEMIRLLR